MKNMKENSGEGRERTVKYLIKAIIKRRRDINVSPPPKTTASIEENDSHQ